LQGKLLKSFRDRPQFSSPRPPIVINASRPKMVTLKGRGSWFGRDSSALIVKSNRIATQGEDGKIRLWDEYGNLLGEYEGYAMSLSSDGQELMAVSARDNLPRIYPVRDLDGLLKQGCDWLRGIWMTEGYNELAQVCQAQEQP
jgi:WD40 repeat protein